MDFEGFVLVEKDKETGEEESKETEAKMDEVTSQVEEISVGQQEEDKNQQNGSEKTPEGTNESIEEKQMEAREEKLKKKREARIEKLNKKKQWEEEDSKGFNAQNWRAEFEECVRQKLRSGFPQLRLRIQRQTWLDVKRGFYFLSDGTKVEFDLQQMKLDICNNVQYPSNHPWKQYLPKPKFSNTVITVKEGDCLECAIDWKKAGKNPAVLNMANANTPGGGYRGGSGAQEENICRRTNLWQHIEDPDQIDTNRKWRYPIPESGGIYSPNVVVFRASEALGYEYLEKTWNVGIISCAACVHPPVYMKDGKFWMEEGLAELTKDKIRAILSIAAFHNHDSVVLSAFGCGAFCNPPQHMAMLFKEVILNEFQGYFSDIAFAIINDHNSHRMHNPDGNFKPFLDELGDISTDMFTSKSSQE